MSNSSIFASIPFDFAGGIVDIAALTSLVGSTTAESLALGNRGSAGLAWATLSISGTLSVVKACLAATTPGWLRETIGVRNSRIDNAVGLSMNLKDKTRTRNRAGGAVGVSCEVLLVSHNPAYRPFVPELNILQHDDGEVMPKRGVSKGAKRDVYAFDQYTSSYLDDLQSTDLTASFKAYICTPDPFVKDGLARATWRDAIYLLLSSIKLIEVFVLWRYGATPLCWITGSSWVILFLGASALQFVELSKEYKFEVENHGTDIIAGQLPTPLKPGGQRKILLGCPTNPRLSPLWRLIWGIGALVCLLPVLATYVLLGRQDPNIFYIWAGFQLFGLISRSAFFHFAEEGEKLFLTTSKDWKRLTPTLRARVCNLVFAVSKYQMQIHSRGYYCYNDDTEELSILGAIEESYPLSTTFGDEVKIHFDSVLGDTLLSSACWVFGSKLSGLDLFDSCIVGLKMHGTIVNIPSARLCTSARPENIRVRSAESGHGILLAPKGGSNSGKAVIWWYYIPCQNGLWLQVSSEKLNILGERTATVLSDEQVTAKLRSGDLFVSISEVEEVKEIVRNSVAGAHVLLDLLC